MSNNTNDMTKVADLLDDNVKENKLIVKIIDRLQNWKFRSAARTLLHGDAKDKKDISDETWVCLDALHGLYGDCGWQDGHMYEPIKMSVNWVAHLLGYTFDEKKENYVKVNK